MQYGIFKVEAVKLFYLYFSLYAIHCMWIHNTCKKCSSERFGYVILIHQYDWNCVYKLKHHTNNAQRKKKYISTRSRMYNTQNTLESTHVCEHLELILSSETISTYLLYLYNYGGIVNFPFYYSYRLTDFCCVNKMWHKQAQLRRWWYTFFCKLTRLFVW